jgi:hypothetical protein
MDDRRLCFERNLLALSSRNPALCSRLSAAKTAFNRYRFTEARSGGIVPALLDRDGAAHPLHSMVDPRREGDRLMSTLKDEGFLIFLGLGGGYAPEAALRRPEIFRVIVIEYDINGVAELLYSREYITIMGDPRFTLLVDPAPEAIETRILEQYRPVLAGGIRTFPLRARTEQDNPRFGAAAAAVRRAIEKVSSDYSVQAHFGTRWFSNIIRNLKTAEAQNRDAPPVREAAICAAGPSLDGQLVMLAERKKRWSEIFIIAADTALPALLKSGIEPDAVVSIDCQHISYYHFMGCLSRNISLFLDIASPPLLAGLFPSPFFFSGGHPLALYASREWRPLPRIDTSGGNVTYACLSLAENLGAKKIRVYGADFSYPRGRVYARGTYIYPFFEKKQNRFASMEAQFSTFLYRSPFLPPGTVDGKSTGYYQTSALTFYRESFENKAADMDAEIIIEPGMGAPIRICPKKSPGAGSRPCAVFAAGRPRMGFVEFLERYRNAIAALPTNAASGCPQNPGAEEERVFTTLLPQAAALKRRRPELTAGELIEAVKSRCVSEIDRVLQANERCGSSE